MYKKRCGAKETLGNIDINLIDEKLLDCPDIIRKKVCIDNKQDACFIYINGLVDKDLLQRDFIRPIVSMNFEELVNSDNIINLPCTETALLYDLESVVKSIMTGSAVFICDALRFAVSYTIADIEKKSIEEPDTEKNIRGPHEGFVEPLVTNLSIVRRKINFLYITYFSFVLILSSMPRDINQVFKIIDTINLMGMVLSLFLVLCLFLSL